MQYISGDLHLGFPASVHSFPHSLRTLVRLWRKSVSQGDSKAQMCGRSYWSRVFGAGEVEVVSNF